MEIQTPPVCLMNFVINVPEETAPIEYLNDDSTPDKTTTYLFDLQQPDGTSQVIQLSEDEAKTLGIFTTDSPVSSDIINTVSDNNVETKQIDSSNAADKIIPRFIQLINERQQSDTSLFMRGSLANDNFVKQSNKSVSRKAKQGVKLVATERESPTQLLQLTTEAAKALGIVVNDTAVNPLDTIRVKPLDVPVGKTQTRFKSFKKKSAPLVYSSPLVKIKDVIRSKTNVGPKKNLNGVARAVQINTDGILKIIPSDVTNSENKLIVAKKKLHKSRFELITNTPLSIKKPPAANVSSPANGTKKKMFKNPVVIAESAKKLGKVVKKTTLKNNGNNSKKIAFTNAAPSNNVDSEAKPLGSCENPIEIIKDGETFHSTQNLSQDYLQQIAKALQLESTQLQDEQQTRNGSTNIIYRVVYPEELDLNPTPEPPKPQKRGRPRRQSSSDEEMPMKKPRTRYGRVTRPPEHIRKNFEKIETSEADDMETDLKTVKFGPLETNQVSTTTVVDATHIKQLENHQRKRLIASQFRCPTCKKAYLGHSKMLKHLQLHPDHGPIPERCQSKDNDTWNFLIDTSNKNPAGQRGVKFCNELVSFLHNVRKLAKLLFKRPSGGDRKSYFVDSMLSNVLGIESGDYVLNENELHKDVNVFSSFKNNSISGEKSTSSNPEKDLNENFNLDELVQKCQTNDDSKSNFQENNFNSFNNGFHDKNESKRENVNDLSLHNELLADNNSLLNSLPHLRNSVEELMLNAVDTAQVGNLLDNSTSSDEVINVDQFVNERFKNLTESDLEPPNTSLHLDLPSLELFQFHTS